MTDVWLEFSLGCFLSGFSALLYQIVWQRLLGLFTGSDVRSVTIVVGAYLAGLGLGNWLGSLVADRLSSRAAVRVFGLSNLGIAAYAFASKLIFYDLLFLRLPYLAASPALTLLIAFASLLLPTTLMGLSLPLLSRAIVRSLDEAAALVGRLEGANILGAAGGTIIGGWVLIGTLGFDRSAYVGGALSSIVGLMALLAARRFENTDAATTIGSTTVTSRQPIPAAVWRWCIAVGVSGFISISLEVLWFRILNVVLVSQAYTFTQLLAFILLGYAIGAILGTRLLPRIANPQRTFLVIQGAVMVYVLASVWILYTTASTLGAQINALPLDLPTGGIQENNVLLGLFVIPAVLLLLPNILIGMTIPIVQKGVQTGDTSVSQRVGLVLGATTLGNTLGSVVTGTMLLGMLGTSGTLRLLGLLSLGFMLLLVWLERGHGRTLYRVGSVMLGVGLLAAVLLFPSNDRLWTRLHGGTSPETLVGEDATGVSVIVPRNGAALIYADGAVQGAIPFMAIHPRLGSLAALLHPNPERMLLIGIGSAGTPYGAGLNPATTYIRAVELIGAELPVLQAYAHHPEGKALAAFFADPRYDIQISDGRRELALSDERFDIIQADAILPWKSHAGLLYSREFFEQVRAKLTTGGFMAQWLPTTRTLNTFMAAFPYGINISDTFAIGSNQPVVFDRDLMLQRLDDPTVIAYLTRGDVDSAHLRQIITTMQVTPWDPSTPRMDPVNTDLLPQDEYFLN